MSTSYATHTDLAVVFQGEIRQAVRKTVELWREHHYSSSRDPDALLRLMWSDPTGEGLAALGMFITEAWTLMARMGAEAASFAPRLLGRWQCPPGVPEQGAVTTVAVPEGALLVYGGPVNVELGGPFRSWTNGAKGRQVPLVGEKGFVMVSRATHDAPTESQFIEHVLDLVRSYVAQEEAIFWDIAETAASSGKAKTPVASTAMFPGVYALPCLSKGTMSTLIRELERRGHAAHTIVVPRARLTELKDAYGSAFVEERGTMPLLSGLMGRIGDLRVKTSSDISALTNEVHHRQDVFVFAAPEKVGLFREMVTPFAESMRYGDDKQPTRMLTETETALRTADRNAFTRAVLGNDWDLDLINGRVDRLRKVDRRGWGLIGVRQMAMFQGSCVRGIFV